MVFTRRRAVRLAAMMGVWAALPAFAQEAAPTVWMRLEPLPAEMRMTPRESFEGVPPRFVLLTDGSAFVGGRRDILRGFLDKTEMQSLSTQLDLALRALGKGVAPPKTLTLGDGPAIFRFSVVAGTPIQTVIMGDLQSPPPVKTPTSPLVDFIRRLANFRHPSLKPFDPPEFAMIVREKTLTGGCRSPRGLPPLNTTEETRVPAATTYGFPTGADLTQVCDGTKRYTVLFRPVIPGDR